MFTHVVFSAGVALFMCKLFAFDAWTSTILTALTVLMQYAIDSLSHEEVNIRGKSISRRTPLFHSPIGALILPSVFTALTAIMLRPGAAALLKHFIVLTAASYSHLLLDLPTGRGIYVGGRRVWKKEKFRYDDPLLNLLFVFLGVLLAYFALR